MVAFTGIVGVYNVVVHDHDHVREGLPYNRIRNKPFPWHECPDCEVRIQRTHNAHTHHNMTNDQ